MTRFAIPGLDMAGGVERVPDRSLVLDDATETSIHRLLADGRWLHLSVSDNAKVVSRRCAQFRESGRAYQVWSDKYHSRLASRRPPHRVVPG